MTEEPRFYNVTLLAQHLKRHIAVYDLEATTFRGRKNFGITEVWCFVVPPSGPGVSFGSLINPEQAIDAEVQRLTGITQSMVRTAEVWGARYADVFKRFASGECWLAGFNNSTFDNHAVKDMNARYGRPIEVFEKTFDIRRLHHKLANSTSATGTLVEIALKYGVTPRGDAHRAQADVILTLELLNAIVELYGVAAVASLIEPKPSGATDKLSFSAVAKYAKGKKTLTLEQLATAFKKDVRTVSFELGKAIDERMVDPSIFASQPAQDWLAQALPEVPLEALETGRLTQINAALLTDSPPQDFDYIQLRVGLLAAGLAWGSLKPS